MLSPPQRKYSEESSETEMPMSPLSHVMRVCRNCRHNFHLSISGSSEFCSKDCRTSHLLNQSFQPMDSEARKATKSDANKTRNQVYEFQRKLDSLERSLSSDSQAPLHDHTSTEVHILRYNASHSP